MATAKSAAPAPAYRPAFSKVLLNVPELGVLIAVVVFFVGFLIVDKRIGQLGNLQLMATEGSMVGLAAFGMSFLMIAGEIDLSAGATAALGAAVFGLLRANEGWPELACAVVAMAAAVGVGLFNSFVVLRIRMPSFFATLGSSFLVTGLATWLLQGSWIWMGDQIPLFINLVKPSPVFGLAWIVLLVLPAYIIGDLLIRFTRLNLIAVLPYVGVVLLVIPEIAVVQPGGLSEQAITMLDPLVILSVVRAPVRL